MYSAETYRIRYAPVEQAVNGSGFIYLIIL